jgi:hypothetical protein
MFFPGVVWIGSFACFGVAVDLRGKQMCQWRGAIRRETLLKNAKGRLYYFFNHSYVQIFFVKSKLPEAVHLSDGEYLFVECHLLDVQIVRALLLPTFVFAQWCDFEAASCPRHQAWNEDSTLSNTSPHH